MRKKKKKNPAHYSKRVVDGVGCQKNKKMTLNYRSALICDTLLAVFQPQKVGSKGKGREEGWLLLEDWICISVQHNNALQQLKFTLSWPSHKSIVEIHKNQEKSTWLDTHNPSQHHCDPSLTSPSDSKAIFRSSLMFSVTSGSVTSMAAFIRSSYWLRMSCCRTYSWWAKSELPCKVFC